MSRALPCVLLRFEGPSSWDLFRTCIESLTAQETSQIHWITDAVLPVDTEASESHVWNLIARRLGAGNDRHGLQILLHRYSPSRTLAAVTGHPSLESDESLLRLTHAALAAYADALGKSARRMDRSDHVRLGAPLSLPAGEWSWRGLDHISDELHQLVTACYIGLYLFTGESQISMDILEPAQVPGGADTIFSLSMRMSGELPLKSVGQHLKAIRGNADLITRGATLNSRGIVLGHSSGSTNSEFHIGDLIVIIEESQRVAPWGVKLVLPPVGSCETPRIESTLSLDTAAALLTHLYDSLASVPDIPISAVTISRETPTIAAFSVATRDH